MAGPIDSAKNAKQRENAKAIVKFSKMHERKEIANALQLSDDPILKQLGDALTDKNYLRCSVALMARNYGVSYRKLATCVFESKIDEGKIMMSKHIPRVMEDLALDSLSREKTCPICEGKGVKVYGLPTKDEVSGETIEPLAEDCKECGGSGKVRVQGDSSSRKMVMEATGLTGKGVSVDARSLTLNVPDGLEDTLALVKKVRDVQRDVQRKTIEIEAADGSH
jgi:hypothetical protein